MDHKVSMFGIGYVIAIFVLLVLGDITLAILAAFILFAGLRIAGH